MKTLIILIASVVVVMALLIYAIILLIFKEILRIVSNEYNNGNIPHTNSTPLNSEKELIYMKATGIVRRIDDLGRIVIPKENRRTFKLREGNPSHISPL